MVFFSPTIESTAQFIPVKRIELCNHRRMFRVIDGQLGLVAVGVHGHIEIASYRRCKRAHHAVVICIGDRIEFMIVAPSAADGQSEHGRANRSSHVIQFIVALFLSLIGRDLRGMHTCCQKPSRSKC